MLAGGGGGGGARVAPCGCAAPGGGGGGGGRRASRGGAAEHSGAPHSVVDAVTDPLGGSSPRRSGGSARTASTSTTSAALHRDAPSSDSRALPQPALAGAGASRRATAAYRVYNLCSGASTSAPVANVGASVGPRAVRVPHARRDARAIGEYLARRARRGGRDPLQGGQGPHLRVASYLLSRGARRAAAALYGQRRTLNGKGVTSAGASSLLRALPALGGRRGAAAATRRVDDAPAFNSGACASRGRPSSPRSTLTPRSASRLRPTRGARSTRAARARPRRGIPRRLRREPRVARGAAVRRYARHTRDLPHAPSGSPSVGAAQDVLCTATSSSSSCTSPRWRPT